MKGGLFFGFYLLLAVGFIACDEPIGSTTAPVVEVPIVDTTATQVDTMTTQVDSCENRLSQLSTLIGCPEFVAGRINESVFSGIADAGVRANLGPDYSIVNIRSFDGEIGYDMELGLTFNGNPEQGQVYPLTTDGDDLATWHAVDPDSVYIALGIWLDAADLNPGILYKYSPSLPNWIRVDSSSFTTYEGEPVTDHFGALEATLVLNETAYIQDNVQYYLDRGFCVPDTIFLRDVCFDARTRDVDEPCRRKAGR